MNKSQLIEALAARYDGNRKQAAHALESVLDTITREVVNLKKGEKVGITGFGSFEKRERPRRKVRNPRTGEQVIAKKTTVPRFNPGAELKSVVSGAKKLPKLTAAKSTTGGQAAKKAGASKSAASKTSASTAKKTTAKKASTGKTAAAKTAATKSAATKSAATKSAATKSAATKAPAKKTAAKKSAATSTAKRTTTKKAATSPAKKTTATKAPAKKTTAKSTAKRTAKKS